jgi:hypothetical protein
MSNITKALELLERADNNHIKDYGTLLIARAQVYALIAIAEELNRINNDKREEDLQYMRACGLERE